jgi:hypothetical protein
MSLPFQTSTLAAALLEHAYLVAAVTRRRVLSVSTMRSHA